MKLVILAGGMGTRISEESALRPKPLVEIGGRPILWHIMKLYSTYGVNDFVICLGYKGYMIEPWRVTLVDTGDSTQTGGRLGRVSEYVGNENFCFTYGDGVGDIDIEALLRFHESHGCIVTLTATQPPGRFGALGLDGTRVNSFQEKPQGDGGFINGGFFVLSPAVFRYIDGDDTVWERAPLERLAAERQVQAYIHRGFWHPMDTLRDKRLLEDLWASGNAPWKRW